MGQAAQLPRIRHVRNVAHVLMRLTDQVTDEERRHISKKYGVFSFAVDSIYHLGPQRVEELLSELIKLSCSATPRVCTRVGSDAEATRAKGIAAIVARAHEFPSACVIEGKDVAQYDDQTLIATSAAEIAGILRTLEWAQADIERMRSSEKAV